ncbi:protein FAM24A-like [Rattus rattus]|uniref:protein FAM24A-like n=1 Tax=Rattus rattus TaxID=10117 RepID=UPI0013F318D6|nr:protein FAM24A-like [Rattus rattus]
MFSSFDLRTIIMIIIGSGILAAMFLLTGVVLCLYSKIARALNPCGTGKELDDQLCSDPCKTTQDQIIRVNSLNADTCRPFHGSTIGLENCQPLQCFSACGTYEGANSLTPCLCNTKEGL